jgi:hypothetical protein
MGASARLPPILAKSFPMQPAPQFVALLSLLCSAHVRFLRHCCNQCFRTDNTGRYSRFVCSERPARARRLLEVHVLPPPLPVLVALRRGLQCQTVLRVLVVDDLGVNLRPVSASALAEVLSYYVEKMGGNSRLAL